MRETKEKENPNNFTYDAMEQYNTQTDIKIAGSENISETIHKKTLLQKK